MEWSSLVGSVNLEKTFPEFEIYADRKTLKFVIVVESILSDWRAITRLYLLFCFAQASLQWRE
ncbi:MAG: hypothetical protein V7609_218 [Verrucomicrobiota bacterium]